MKRAARKKNDWMRTTLGSIIRPRRDKVSPSSELTARYIGMEHVEAHSTRLLETAPAYSMRSSANRFQSGDVLYGRLRPYLNKVCRPGFSGLCSAEFIVLPKTEGIDPDFLKYRLNAGDFLRFASQLNAGDRPRVDFDQLAPFEIELPPLDKQRRIVGEIEKQFTRLDAGVVSLNRVQTALKRYRASVLKAACGGRLVPTEAELAHKENGSYETGEQLLQRILKERRETWNGKGKYKEPLSANSADLSPLPEGWTWATLEQLLSSLRNGWSYKPDAVAGIPILRISSVRPMLVNPDDVRYLKGSIRQYVDYLVHGGELLFTRYNGNPQLTGVCGVVPPLTQATVYPDKLIRVELVPGLCEPKFACMSANVGVSREFLASRARTTAGQTGISGADLRQMPIPLAPLPEQTRIVVEVDRRLSVIDELEIMLATTLQRVGRIRRSVLARAFDVNHQQQQ